MRITTIRYRQNKNLGNYESAHIEAEAEVNPGESPSEAMAQLKRWVREELEGKRNQQEEEDSYNISDVF